VVLIAGAYAVGAWVSDRIEQGVVQNSGVSAALYIESLIPNQTRDEGENQPISDEARLALQRAFQEGVLQERVVTYNVFSDTGLILDSYRSKQRGVQTEPSKALLQALSGKVATQFQTLQAQADHPGATIGVPLLEVYVPIRDANTGEVLFVSEAAQRSTAQSEKIMQRTGQDLHDGVAQHLSLASLRLEAAGLGPSKDAEIVKSSLDNAMKELRGISRGLALPDLASHDLAACAAQAVREHNKGFGSDVRFDDVTCGAVRANDATKLCVYRFLQEALSNAARHAHAQSISTRLSLGEDWIEVLVSDDGCGFVPDETAGVRDDGGQGLIGLTDRAATLGGTFLIKSNTGEGTQACLRLPVMKEEK